MAREFSPSTGPVRPRCPLPYTYALPRAGGGIATAARPGFMTKPQLRVLPLELRERLAENRDSVADIAWESSFAFSTVLGNPNRSVRL